MRWSGGNFLCLVADDGEDGSALVGACDLTLLPAGGPKRSREGLVADVPTELNLPEDTHFLYLTGMVVPATYRRRGIGQALLHRCEAMAGKIEPAPAYNLRAPSLFLSTCSATHAVSYTHLTLPTILLV